MRCLQCGNRLALFRKLTDGAFCSDPHRKLYQQQQNQLALARLQESQGKIDKVRKATPPPAAAPAGSRERASYLVEQPRECVLPERLLSAPCPAPQVPETAIPGLTFVPIEASTKRSIVSLAGPVLLGMRGRAIDPPGAPQADALPASVFELQAFPVLSSAQSSGVALGPLLAIPGLLQAPGAPDIQSRSVAPELPGAQPVPPRLVQATVTALHTSHLLPVEVASAHSAAPLQPKTLAESTLEPLSTAPYVPPARLRTLAPELQPVDWTPRTTAGLTPLVLPLAFGSGEANHALWAIESAELAFPKWLGLLPASSDRAQTAQPAPRAGVLLVTPPNALAATFTALAAALVPLDLTAGAPSLPLASHALLETSSTLPWAKSVAPPLPQPRDEQVCAPRALAAVAAVGVATTLPALGRVSGQIAPGRLPDIASLVALPVGLRTSMACAAPATALEAVEVGETGILLPAAAAGVFQPHATEALPPPATVLLRLDWARAVAPRGTHSSVKESSSPLHFDAVRELPVSPATLAVGPRGAVKMFPLRQAVAAAKIRTEAKDSANWLWHTSPPLWPASRFEPISDRQAAAGIGSLLNGRKLAKAFGPVAHFWSKAPADLRWMAMVIPLVLALAYYSVTPTGKVFAKQSEKGSRISSIVSGQWHSLNQQLLRRAAVELRDDFRSGLASWSGVGEWAKGWSYDGAGFVRTGPLAIYQPSVDLTDYRMEFLGQIEKKSLGWVYRAADSRNYYVTKLTILKPGPMPTAGIVRYTVVDGKEGPPVTLPLPMSVRNDTVYRVRLDARGSDFVTSVQGQVVDVWSDTRFKSGGVGFFSNRGEEGKLRWVEVSHQYDVLGRLCAFLAPYSMPNTNGRSSQ